MDLKHLKPDSWGLVLTHSSQFWGFTATIALPVQEAAAAQTGPSFKQLSLQGAECPEHQHSSSWAGLGAWAASGTTRATFSISSAVSQGANSDRKGQILPLTDQGAGQEKITQPGRVWEGRRNASGEEGVGKAPWHKCGSYLHGDKKHTTI